MNGCAQGLFFTLFTYTAPLASSFWVGGWWDIAWCGSQPVTDENYYPILA